MLVSQLVELRRRCVLVRDEHDPVHGAARVLQGSGGCAQLRAATTRERCFDRSSLAVGAAAHPRLSPPLPELPTREGPGEPPPPGPLARRHPSPPPPADPGDA